MGTDDTKPIVLLIDDSVDVHRLLHARLRNEDIDLVAMADARAALEYAKVNPVATILLDLEMPEVDGFEALRALKDDAATRNIPVIVLSGLRGSDDKVTAFDLGATDYVTKPADLAELRARLRAALRTHHLLLLLAERADVDGLTGLGNRAAFEKRWSEKVAECMRYSRSLSLAILDVDHFKRINDSYGHPAGDEVLQGLAKLLHRECRAHDIACRYGGEEFAMVMPSTPPADAAAVMQRLRKKFAKIVWPRHPDTLTTVSIGVAGTDGSSPIGAREWVEAADRNLYAAKRQGRDRVVTTDLSAFRGRLADAG